MMANEKEIFDVSMSGYSAAIIQEQAAYQQAQLSGDLGEAVRASQSIAALRSQAGEYQRMATEHVTSMQATPRSNKYGLSDAEAEIALKSVPERSDYRGGNLSTDDMLKTYAENKQRYARMRQTGEYSNQTDQGRR